MIQGKKLAESNEVSGPLERYLSIMEVVLASRDGLNAADLCKILDLPKPTAHRLLSALSNANALDVVDDGLKTYRVGSRLSRMLALGRDENVVINYCQIVCNELVNELDETCYVVRLTPMAAYTIAVAVTEQSYRLHVSQGSEMSLHAAATARILLAYQDDASRARYLERPFVKMTPYTKMRVSEVQAEIKRAKRDGYATCIGEIDPSTMAYAVPVFLPAGVFYSIGVTGPQFRIKKKPLDSVIHSLRAAADKLQRLLETASTSS